MGTTQQIALTADEKAAIAVSACIETGVNSIFDAALAAIRAEREACAKIVHDRLGADGYGVAQLIRARSKS